MTAVIVLDEFDDSDPELTEPWDYPECVSGRWKGGSDD